LCHLSVLDFVRAGLSLAEVGGRRVLEVGSRDVNGGVRPLLTSLGASAYVGVDKVAGPGVDRLCDVVDLAAEFGDDPFEVVVTTEMLEHVRDWRAAVANLKRVVAPGGLLVVTTRSYGFPYHEFPGDFWRYELEDMRWIFRDFEILSLGPDSQAPGVFMKARKPSVFQEADLSGRKLFAVVKGEPAEPDGFTDEESTVYGERATQLGEVGAAIRQAVLAVDLADIGKRDFRNLWRSAARLSDLVEEVTPGSRSRPLSARWRRGMERLRREALERLTAARLARGRSFGRARQAILKSAAGSTQDNALRVPWGRLEEARFREILDAAERIRTVCLKVRSYSRPPGPG